MGMGTKDIAIVVGVLMLTGFNTTAAGAGGPQHSNHHLRKGAVYAMTNQSNNQVAVFRRNGNGSLTPAGMFPTGGGGDPVPPGIGPPNQPFAFPRGMIISPGKRFPFFL